MSRGGNGGDKRVMKVIELTVVDIIIAAIGVGSHDVMNYVKTMV